MSNRIGNRAGLGSAELLASLVYLLKSFDNDQVLRSLFKKKIEIKSVWLTTLIPKAWLSHLVVVFPPLQRSSCLFMLVTFSLKTPPQVCSALLVGQKSARVEVTQGHWTRVRMTNVSFVPPQQVQQS